MLKIKNASHEETDPHASIHIINKLSCSLIGESQTMYIIPATIAYQAYGKESIIERFQCNYGLNEKYRNDLIDGRLKITGFDENDNARMIEISKHRFFIATLFLPQFISKPDISHPLILAFINAAIKFRDMKEDE